MLNRSLAVNAIRCFSLGIATIGNILGRKSGRWELWQSHAGGVRYKTTFKLSEQEATGSMELDLGKVVATAEVSVNGKKIGVRVAPPWTFDLTGSLNSGENEIEVLVFNTLANHDQTIPSQYRGDPASGLFGPVRLRSTQLRSTKKQVSES